MNADSFNDLLTVIDTVQVCFVQKSVKTRAAVGLKIDSHMYQMTAETRDRKNINTRVDAQNQRWSPIQIDDQAPDNEF